ncbi:MAG TPA: asparagine synthase (glutamine-hydrolyzing) [Bryobacteraceae bacterium]|nr:asparagine synthase (glutamine-hydrolyzing) [Bryobacteraceae bacterium]
MCGIAGFTHQSYRPDPAIIRGALASIRHRGPDQEGAYESDIVSLGAVRLKIIDLAGGDQPMQAGGAVIAFNGEIYNHVELRRELEQRGHTFRSHCDTEVVLHAFLEWDLDCFRQFRGMFAVALWTERERRLVLARDRMGIKPLYIAQRSGDLHFGSELKAIWAHPEVPRRVSADGLNRFFSLNYIPGEYTLAEGICKLPPAHWLEWRDSEVQTGRYWSYRLDPRPLELEDAKGKLDGLLRASVREHLISDVPLGVWASGGLDSSTVLHYAAQAVPHLKTFSVSFAGHGHDESRWFREVAARYGTDHHEFDLNPEAQIRDTIERMSYFSDEPSSDAGALPVWFLSRMCRSQVTVALSGEGADELFGGYNTYLADGYARVLRRVPRPLRKAALAVAHCLPASDEKIGFDYKLKRLLEGALLPAAEAHFFWNGTWSQDARRELLTDWRPVSFQNGNGLWVDQHNYLPDDILYKTDRMSMAHSLEVRPPFLDHRIVEFAARLPDDMKVRDGTLKFVLRELMRDKLPRSVITRPKEGFDIPTHKWFRGVLKPLLQDCVNERSVRDTGLFQWPAVERVIGDHLARRANYGYHLWGLLTFFLWKNRWNVATS